MDNCNNLVLKVSIYSLISINCLICIMILGIEYYLNDNQRVFKQLFIYTTVSLIFLLNSYQAYVLLKNYKIKALVTIMIIICSFSVLFGLFTIIFQISEKSLEKNGSGKVPLVDPHTAFWYQISKTNTILSYVLTIFIILEELCVYMNLTAKKQMKNKFGSDQTSPQLHKDSFLQNNQDWSQQIISDNFIQKQKHSSSMNDIITNTIPSKKQCIEQLMQSISEKQELEQKEYVNNESWKNSINSMYAKNIR